MIKTKPAYSKIDLIKIEIFRKKLNNLLLLRRSEYAESKKRTTLNIREKQLIYEKTDGRCHVCGIEISLKECQADHVKTHTSGGESLVNNYLPACRTCNRYRWHFHPEELQLILKLGVRARREVFNNSELGKQLAHNFLAHEEKREGRK